MKLSRRARTLLGSICVGLVGSLCVAVSAPPANAASDNPDRSYSKPYTSNWVFRSTKLKRCAFISVSGTVTGTWRYAYRLPSGAIDKSTVVWSALRLNNPSVQVTGWPISGSGCDSTKRWKIRADITQGWQQYDCRLSVSIGAGYPWSVSVTPNVKCGKQRNGHFSSTEGPSTKTLSQFNSGAPVRFGSVLSPSNVAVAFLQNVTVRVHTSNASDLFRKNLNVYVKK